MCFYYTPQMYISHDDEGIDIEEECNNGNDSIPISFFYVI
jgi:hypothetical protein